MRRNLLPLRRFGVMLLGLLALSCGPAPEATLGLVTLDSPEAGLRLRELPAEALRTVGLPFGLAVVRAGGSAERAGLKVGDVVYGVNRKKAESLKEFNRLLSESETGELGLMVRRGRTDFYVSIDLGAAPPLPATDTLLRT